MNVSFNTRKVRRGVLILVVNIVPILVFLGLGELYLRNTERKPYLRTYPGQYQNVEGKIWARPDRLLGWTVNPEWLPPEINPEGFRYPKPYASLPAKSDKTRVMVLGDSFVFGVALGPDENLTSLLQAGLADDYEVFNFGVPGWGIDQMYLAYQHYKDLIKPDIVILAFIDDDILRALEAYRKWEQLNKPSFTTDDGAVVLQTSAAPAKLYLNETIGKSIFLSMIMHEVYFVTEAKPIVHYILSDMARDVKSRGGSFVVVRIPTVGQTKPMQTLRRRLMDYDKMLENSDVIYLDPAREMMQDPNWAVDLYFPAEHPGNAHLNKAGNELLADYIIGRVFENRIISR